VKGCNSVAEIPCTYRETVKEFTGANKKNPYQERNKIFNKKLSFKLWKLMTATHRHQWNKRRLNSLQHCWCYSLNCTSNLGFQVLKLTQIGLWIVTTISIQHFASEVWNSLILLGCTACYDYYISSQHSTPFCCFKFLWYSNTTPKILYCSCVGK